MARVVHEDDEADGDGQSILPLGGVPGNGPKAGDGNGDGGGK